MRRVPRELVHLFSSRGRRERLVVRPSVARDRACTRAGSMQAQRHGASLGRPLKIGHVPVICLPSTDSPARSISLQVATQRRRLLHKHRGARAHAAPQHLQAGGGGAAVAPTHGKHLSNRAQSTLPSFALPPSMVAFDVQRACHKSCRGGRHAALPTSVRPPPPPSVGGRWGSAHRRGGAAP